jgi:hypothetical protein
MLAELDDQDLLRAHSVALAVRTTAVAIGTAAAEEAEECTPREAEVLADIVVATRDYRLGLNFRLADFVRAAAMEKPKQGAVRGRDLNESE